tara:strand:- start:1442 stop:1639 length:198 start_codon:yes stop_codon:yes gene_type:complete
MSVYEVYDQLIESQQKVKELKQRIRVLESLLDAVSEDREKIREEKNDIQSQFDAENYDRSINGDD